MSDKKTAVTSTTKISKYCVFCRQSITNILHIHCLEPCCSNFDMCLHCFSLGMSLDSHQPTHRYKIIENTDIPVFTDDWRANEELLLLEAVEKCGIGNWGDIAAFVGKNEQQCEEHYFSVYIFSQYSPLPDLTLPYPYTAKIKLLENQHINHSTDSSLDINIENLTFYTSPTTSIQHPHSAQNNIAEYCSYTYNGTPINPTTGPVEPSTGPFTANSETTTTTTVTTAPTYHNTAKVLNLNAIDYYEKWYRCRLRQAHFEKPSETSRWKLQQMEYKAQQKNNLSLSVGYLPHRNDYEVEYINDAEKDICEMEFRFDDSTIEKELKLRVLELYNNILDERIERKEFIDRYQLLLKRDKRLTREEQFIYKALRPFARYLEAEEYDELVRSVVIERTLRLRIEQLQTYRLNGIQTLQDGVQFDNEYAEVVKQWETKYKKKYLDVSNIPIGQYDALKNVLNDIDATIATIEKEETNIIRSDGTINPSAFSRNNDPPKDTTPSPFMANTITARPIGGPHAKLIDPHQIPALFKANLSQPQPEPSYEVHIPLDQQKLQLQQQCPCMLSSMVSTATSGTKSEPPKSINNPTNVCTFDINQYPHASLLSQSEQLLCKELHILPQHYLVLKDRLIREAVSNGYITQGVARNVLKVDVHCTDRILHFTISQNIIPPIQAQHQ